MLACFLLLTATGATNSAAALSAEKELVGDPEEAVAPDVSPAARLRECRRQNAQNEQ